MTCVPKFHCCRKIHWLVLVGWLVSDDWRTPTSLIGIKPINLIRRKRRHSQFPAAAGKAGTCYAAMKEPFENPKEKERDIHTLYGSLSCLGVSRPYGAVKKSRLFLCDHEKKPRPEKLVQFHCWLLDLIEKVNFQVHFLKHFFFMVRKKNLVPLSSIVSLMQWKLTFFMPSGNYDFDYDTGRCTWDSSLSISFSS